MDVHFERFIQSLKEGCLDRMILFGNRSLGNAAPEFISHYHVERDRQGLDDPIIEPAGEVDCKTAKIVCRERLDGILRYYYRRAA